MIGVGVREQHRIEPTNLLAQHLDAEFGGGVNDELGLFRRHIDRWPRAMVLRIGQERGRVLLANDRYALRCARAKKDKRKCHYGPYLNQRRPLPQPAERTGATSPPLRCFTPRIGASY